MRLIHKGCGGNITPCYQVSITFGGNVVIEDGKIEFFPDESIDFNEYAEPNLWSLSCDKCGEEWNHNLDSIEIDNLNPEFEIVEA